MFIRASRRAIKTYSNRFSPAPTIHLARQQRILHRRDRQVTLTEQIAELDWLLLQMRRRRSRQGGGHAES